MLSDPIFLYFSYFFKILLYFLYLPKISYISSQNPIFFKTMRKKVESLICSGNFISTCRIEAIQDINADTSIFFF